ncbi:MAG: hypothetical protein J6J86_00095 [Lachnospiraceae bacterium]|nr:hypothetical protein [Lachnospiraceae bacterium]
MHAVLRQNQKSLAGERQTLKSFVLLLAGDEQNESVENVYVRDCTFEDVFSIASVKAICGRGNYIRNVHYENCTMKNHNTEFKDTRWFRGALYIDGFYGEEHVKAHGKYGMKVKNIDNLQVTCDEGEEYETDN